MESGSLNFLEPSGPHWVSYGTPLPFLCFVLKVSGSFNSFISCDTSLVVKFDFECRDYVERVGARTQEHLKASENTCNIQNPKRGNRWVRKKNSLIWTYRKINTYFQNNRKKIGILWTPCMYVFYYPNRTTDVTKRTKTNTQTKSKKKKKKNSPVVQCHFEWNGTGHCVIESEKAPVNTLNRHNRGKQYSNLQNKECPKALHVMPIDSFTCISSA
jgi:hypothetical protein